MPESIQIRIEKLVYGGDGLSHHEGQTVFAPFVLPQELVLIEPVERRKKFIRGKTLGIAEPSPERIAPECSHYGVCGGCNYQHIPYASQLQYKTQILRETLARLGRITWEGAVTAHGSPAYGYRNRAQWKVTQSPETGPAIGYYEAGSQKLVPVNGDCPIISPRLQGALASLARIIAAKKIPGTLREVEAFADHDDAKLLLNLSFDKFDGSHERIAEALREEIAGVETVLIQNIAADRFDLSGPGHLFYRVGKHTYQVGHLSFFQTNRFLLDELVQLVVGDARGKLAIDLFSGVGLFTLPLAHHYERVVGVESNVATARDLEANLQESGAKSPSFRRLDVESFLARWQETPDLVVADPPRSGLPTHALTRLIKLSPRTIAYLSCDPATLARDLAVLVGTPETPGRYHISEVHLVDLFPQTYHMEVFVRLSRRP